MGRRARRVAVRFFAALAAAAVVTACAGGDDDGRDADAGDIAETTDSEAAVDGPGDDASPETDGAADDGPADQPEDEAAEDVPTDTSEDEGSSCTENVPAQNDVLQASGEFLGVMNESTFCASGRVTFTIDDVPAAERTALHEGTTEYVLVFALSNTASRNYIQAMLVRQADDPTSQLVLKVGGGTCLDCECCACRLDPAMRDGWCASEVYRTGCAPFDETAASQTYTISWDSDSHRIWYQRGTGDLREFAKLIPVPFAFNRFCAGGHGCDMLHWGPPRWTTGTVNPDVVFVCDQPVTAAPASCP